jgi:hypothetical protein
VTGVTVPRLQAAEPALWRVAGRALRDLAGIVDDRCGEVDGAAAALRPAWRGPAAAAAGALLARLALGLRGRAPALLAADQALAGLAGRVAEAQRLLAAALAAAPPAARVAPDGSLALPPGGERPDPGELAALRAAGSGVAAALRLAGEADAEAGRRLRALLPALDPGAPPPRPPAAVPPPGADPAGVRRWWEGLPADERAWLLATDPARLGALDGVPAAVRDQANRLALDRARDALRGEPAGRGARAGLDALAARLAADGPGRAYLLGFDPAGDGRAVVAVGDPDRAAHVLTVVPGTGADLGDAADLLARTDRLAARLGPDGAAVLWLGYDAPDDLSRATSRAPAAAAAADLDRYADALRVTHEPGGVHHTVLGHSYGSTVIGQAATGPGLDADDLVFVGSPGVGADRAADLGLPPGHVWSATATWDPIRTTGAVYALPAALADAVTAPPAGAGWPLWHGPDPSGPAFGSERFTTGPGDPRRPVATHCGYLDEGNPALDNVARIARGSYGEVR